MFISLTPVRTDESLTLERQGDNLIINGQVFDLAELADSDPESAPPSPFIVGPVQRSGDGYTVSVLLPYGEDRGADPPQARQVQVTQDGPIELD